MKVYGMRYKQYNEATGGALSVIDSNMSMEEKRPSNLHEYQNRTTGSIDLHRGYGHVTQTFKFEVQPCK